MFPKFSGLNPQKFTKKIKMLQTVFSFRGTDYRGNRIPESYRHLHAAALKIMKVHEQAQGIDSVRGAAGVDPDAAKFTFTYVTPSQTK